MSLDRAAAHLTVSPSRQEVLRIASYPDRNPGNPYIELLYDALRQHSIEHAGRLVLDPGWLDEQRIDVMHIHWPERIWRGRRRGRLDRVAALATGRSIRGVLRMSRFLDRAGARGITRVWTVHNVAHHEGTNAIDRWGYRELARRSDLLVCFSQSAADELRREHGERCQIIVMSHGSYKGAYPPPRPTAEARRRFGLKPHVPVVSCLGLLRPYKGVEVACDAVQTLAGRVQLFVAGQPHKAFYTPGLLARAAASRGAIVALPRTLTDEEFSDAMAASDAVILPYRTVTGSGVLFAAWTMGAGVIASDLPFFREMLAGKPLCGQTFATGDSAALSAALEQYLNIPAEHRRRAIAEAVDRLAPIHVVAPLVDALRQRHSRPRETADAISVRS